MLEVVLERIRLTSKCLKMRHVVLVSKRISSVFSPPVSLSFVCFDEYSLPAAVRRFFYCGGGADNPRAPSPPPPQKKRCPPAPGGQTKRTCPPTPFRLPEVSLPPRP